MPTTIYRISNLLMHKFSNWLYKFNILKRKLINVLFDWKMVELFSFKRWSGKSIKKGRLRKANEHSSIGVAIIPLLLRLSDRIPDRFWEDPGVRTSNPVLTNLIHCAPQLIPPSSRLIRSYHNPNPLASPANLGQYKDHTLKLR